MANLEQLKILLVEDDPADQKLIKSVMERRKIAYELHNADNAEEALDLLCSTDHTRAFIRPDLIILDLNMPGMGGREFLKHIKADEGLKQIPVVILTSSTSEVDIVDSYKLQAAGFVSKPAGLDELERVIRKIEDYWLTLCRLPCKEC